MSFWRRRVSTLESDSTRSRQSAENQKSSLDPNPPNTPGPSFANVQHVMSSLGQNLDEKKHVGERHVFLVQIFPLCLARRNVASVLLRLFLVLSVFLAVLLVLFMSGDLAVLAFFLMLCISGFAVALAVFAFREFLAFAMLTFFRDMLAGRFAQT